MRLNTPKVIREIKGQAKGIDGNFTFLPRVVLGKTKHRELGEDRLALSFDFPKGYTYMDYLPSWEDIVTQIESMMVLYTPEEVEKQLNKGEGFSVIVEKGGK